MLWSEDIPRVIELDSENRHTEIIVIAGGIREVSAPPPAPDSWAADPENEVAIWIIKMDPGAEWILPQASSDLNRSVFFYNGASLSIAGNAIPPYHAVNLRSDLPAAIKNGQGPSHLLLLQGRPIGEPVFQHGPFVMNTREEIIQTMEDYNRTGFGGWPWERSDVVHPESSGRFARYADGKEEQKK